MLLSWSKGTADMSKDLCGSFSQRLKMLLHIREEQFERAAVMIMGDDSSRDEACAIRCGEHQDHRQAYTPDTTGP
jgi:hypothetical protein